MMQAEGRVVNHDVAGLHDSRTLGAVEAAVAGERGNGDPGAVIVVAPSTIPTIEAGGV